MGPSFVKRSLVRAPISTKIPFGMVKLELGLYNFVNGINFLCLFLKFDLWFKELSKTTQDNYGFL
jgi:hypothetical protein